jgi:hypothetical protein
MIGGLLIGGLWDNSRLVSDDAIPDFPTKLYGEVGEQGGTL